MTIAEQIDRSISSLIDAITDNVPYTDDVGDALVGSLLEQAATLLLAKAVAFDASKIPAPLETLERVTRAAAAGKAAIEHEVAS